MPKDNTKSGREIVVSFSVQGFVNQRVRLNPDSNLTVLDIRELLEDGTLATTIQENGTVEYVRSGKVVGTVVNVDNNCEYSDFTTQEG